MPGFLPGIHIYAKVPQGKTWMPGQKGVRALDGVKRLFENFESLVLRSRFVRNGSSKGEVFKEKSSILRDGA
ncbi:MAG: hypothetical protein J0G95_15155 [Rhizobiales bacterium]|nr:hypothetical protein [Hyphomicrobiales bacterium]